MNFADYVVGFVDGEGCFGVSFTRRAKLKTGIEVRPSFSVSQSRRNLEILEEIQKFFGCGGIRFSRSDQCYKFEVRNLAEINGKIIPFFESNRLQTSKQNDFEKFSTICGWMKVSKHRNREELEKIIKLAYQMNQSGKQKYSQAKLLSELGKKKI